MVLLLALLPWLFPSFFVFNFFASHGCVEIWSEHTFFSKGSMSRAILNPFSFFFGCVFLFLPTWSRITYWTAQLVIGGRQGTKKDVIQKGIWEFGLASGLFVSAWFLHG
jgi:hypothetical protein